MAATLFTPTRPYYTPTNKILVVHNTALGVHRYEDDEIWGPDTDIGRSCVLHMALYDPPVGNDTIAFDRSRYQNHGTVTGATWGIQGRTFVEASSNKIVTPVTSINLSGGVTLAAWFKPTTTNTNRDIFSYGSFYLLGGMSLRYSQSNAVPQAVIRLGGVTRQFTFTGALLPAGTFGFVVYTYDNTTNSGYLNGVLKNSSAPGWGSLDAVSKSVDLGMSTGDSTFANGILGEVSIYNRALTANVIQQIHLDTKWRYQ